MPSVIADRPVKIALAGCGRVSRNHFESFRTHAADLELIAVCDIDPERARKHGGEMGVPHFTAFEAMLGGSDPDLVALCTPSGLHAGQTILAAKMGRHVISEKPMATRWRDGLAMVRACAEADVRLFVVKQNRFNPTLRLLKRAIAEQRFGRIYLVCINVLWNRPQEYYDADAWRGTREMDGGALMNQASHYVDLLNWLMGPVAEVQAMTATLARDIQVEDSAVMSVRWRSGALGTLNVTMLAHGKNFEASITVLGEKGTVRIGGVAVNDIQHWEFAESRDYDADVAAANYRTKSVYGFGHPRYYRNVVEVMRGAARPDTDGGEGLKSLEVLVAAYRSARDRHAVMLPLEY